MGLKLSLATRESLPERINRRTSHEALAEASNVTPRYLAGIERGDQNLTLDSLNSLADQLGVPATSSLSSAG